MQQLVVPQFIDVENKIIGPITVRQFVTFLVGFGIIYVEFQIFQFWVAAILGVGIFAITGLFAFAKINGRPFHYFILSLLQTFQRPNLQLWNKAYKLEKAHVLKDRKPEELLPTKRPMSATRLTEIALIVDTGGAYQEGIDELGKK